MIATPGRFLHLLVEMGLSLSTVEYVVFDEADRSVHRNNILGLLIRVLILINVYYLLTLCLYLGCLRWALQSS